MNEEIRAQHAKDMMANPIFDEWLEQVTAGISREMDRTKDNDLTTMQSLVMQRKAANRLVQHLVQVSESSKVTEFNAKPKRGMFKS